MSNTKRYKVIDTWSGRSQGTDLTALEAAEIALTYNGEEYDIEVRDSRPGSFHPTVFTLMAMNSRGDWNAYCRPGDWRSFEVCAASQENAFEYFANAICSHGEWGDLRITVEIAETVKAAA